MSLPPANRRTLLRTAAWSVPAVAVVAAAPAYASSADPDVSLVVTNSGAQSGSGSTFEVTNNEAFGVTVVLRIPSVLIGTSGHEPFALPLDITQSDVTLDGLDILADTYPVPTSDTSYLLTLTMTAGEVATGTLVWHWDNHDGSVTGTLTLLTENSARTLDTGDLLDERFF